MLVPNVPASLYPLVVQVFVSTLGMNVSPTDIVAQYPIGDYNSDVRLAVAAIGTDSLFSCLGCREAQTFSKFVPTHAYEFNDRNAPTVLAPVDPRFRVADSDTGAVRLTAPSWSACHQSSAGRRPDNAVSPAWEAALR